MACVWLLGREIVSSTVISPRATLSLLFFRSTHSGGRTGVNTVPTSCGDSLLREWDVQVRALPFSPDYVSYEAIRSNSWGALLFCTYNGLDPCLLLTCNRLDSQAASLIIDILSALHLLVLNGQQSGPLKREKLSCSESLIKGDKSKAVIFALPLMLQQLNL